MDDAAAMRDSEGFRDVSHPGASARIGDGSLFKNLVQRLAVQELHDEIRSGSGLLDAHVVKRDDVRMRELSDGAGFLQEAFPAFSAGQVRGEQFDGDGATNERVEGSGHAAESACADGVEDLVSADLHGQCPFPKRSSSCERKKFLRSSKLSNSPVPPCTLVLGRSVW